jgi:predicted signal transduction protein with EAL and GGDEF domain
MGVTVSEFMGAKEVQALLSRADAALYAAKDRGRNRVEHVTGSPRKAAPRDRLKAGARQG